LPKGAVIGPLVVCGFLTTRNKIEKLKKLGVKDSKELPAEKRKKLAKEIEKLGDVIVLKIPACKIDANRKHGVNLNLLEAKKMAEIIDMLKPDKAIIDTPGTNTKKFEDEIRSYLENKNVKLICENFADKNYPIVSAASIIAKVERDKSIRELEKKIGRPIGVGYSHDSRTIEFLEKLVKEKDDKLPPYVRKTWDTVEQMVKRHRQRKIFDFFKKLFKK
jgi:ribonuclease HII